MRKIIFAFTVFAVSLNAAIENVRVDLPMAQAIIRYVAPTTAACTVQVWDMNLQADEGGPKATVQIATTSGNGTTVTVDTVLAHGFEEGMTWRVYLEGTGVTQWDGPQTITVVDTNTFTFANATSGSGSTGNVGQLVHDTDDDMFPGSSTDARSTNVVYGRDRHVLVGTRKVEILPGTIRAFSRALQAYARHLFRITCGGDTYNGEFRTSNIPLGYLSVDYPQPAFAGGPIAPDFSKQARWEKSDGAFLSRAIDPVTGVLYTPMYPPELAVDTAFNVSTANTDVPTVATNWINPGDLRTQDGSYASYSDSTQDVICVKPYTVVSPSNGATKAQWWTQNISLENIIATLRGYGEGGTPEARSTDVALSKNCVVPLTEWKTVVLPSSVGNVSFPSGTPRGGFADWHSATQKRLTHVDLYARRGYVNTSGTAVTWVSDSNYGASTGPGQSLFEYGWTAGTKIRIGGGSSVCTAGTEYTIASVESSRALTLVENAGTQTQQWYCVPSLGIMIRKTTTSTDPIHLDYVNFTLRETRIPVEHDSGSAKIFGENLVTDGSGNRGYVDFTIGAGGSTSINHWVSEDNGESRFIMGQQVNLPGISGEFTGGNCFAQENTFSRTAPDTFFCLVARTGGGQTVAAYKIWAEGSTAWKGYPVSSTPLTTCTTTVPVAPNPCLQPINMSGSYNVLDLIQDRNPEYDSVKFPGCGMRGIQSHYLYITCQRSVQDTVFWWAMYDLDKPIASYDPMDQSTNPIVGAIPSWDVGFRGTTGLHTGFTGEGLEEAVIDPKFTRKNSLTDQDGAGPFRLAVSGNTALNNTTDVHPCPPNPPWHHANCSTIIVTSEPFDPDPGPTDAGTPGEFARLAVGLGLRFFRCNETAPLYIRETITEFTGDTDYGCRSYANDEYGRIVAISGTAPTIQLEVSRGNTGITSAGMKNHAAGYSLFLWPQSDLGHQAVDLNVFWDFQTCPTGGSLTCVNYASASTSHGSITRYAMLGYTTASGLAQVVWPDPSPTTVFQTPPINLNLSLAVWPPFAGKWSWRYMGPTQRYTANNHTNFLEARKTAYQWFIDSRPDLYGIIGSDYHWQFAKVSGTTYLYEYDSQLQGDRRLPLIKHLTFLIQSNGKTLVDISGPGSVLNDNSTDHYKKCIAWKADECRTGSKMGDIFVNVPNLVLGQWSKYSCGLAVWTEEDICATPLDPMSGPNMQFWFGSGPNMGRGRHLRKLGWGAQSSLRLSGQVPKVTPNAKWVGPLWTNFLNEHRSGMGLMMKLPPVPNEDGLDRTTFVPMNVGVSSVPAGTAFAQVEFGYAFHGNASQFYCTERRDSCLATGDKILSNAEIRNPWTTSNQNGSWQYTGTTMTNGTPYTLAFSSPHKFSSDLRVKATAGTTNANYYKGWPINIINSTTVELVGSNMNDIGSTGTVTSMVEKLEAPFAFASESVGVADATNATPIEITTTARHYFQTGSRVCLAGVAGNTAANGCYQITATGPSSFRLDGTTGNGSYVSGGTVTPGGVPCASDCTIAIPGKTRHAIYYRWRYLNSAGTLIFTGPTELSVVP